MKHLLFAVASTAVLTLPLLAQPRINSALNNYSYTLPGTPNYVFAQGSIFTLFTANAGPSTLVSQTYPLQKTLGGVTINVTVGGTTVQAIPYYVSAGQIAAILPSNTPTGNGTLTITYNSQTSAAFNITVVQSAVGLLTMNQAGSGPAAVLTTDFKYVTQTNALNPGEYAHFWGTGAGASAGDETQYPFPQANLASLPFEAWVGGIQAEVAYHGRSQYPGLDQYTLKMPQGVSGCYVSVVFKTGNYVSNTVSVPIATTGRVCSDSNGFTAADLEKANAQGNLRVGMILLDKSRFTTPGITIPGQGTFGGGTITTDSATASFMRYTPTQLNSSTGLFRQASVGGCMVFTMQGQSSSFVDPVQPTLLDAGTITMTTPTGAQQMSKFEGFYLYPSGASTTEFIPAGGGTFSFDNGAGGVDVKTLTSASLTMGSPLVWTNMDAISNIQRSAGVTVEWSGGNPNTYVVISGYATKLNPQLITMFTCTAPVSAQRFTVPSAVLLSLVQSESQSTGGITIASGSALTVSNYTNPKTFTATGLDTAMIVGSSTSGKLVNYQ